MPAPVVSTGRAATPAKAPAIHRRMLRVGVISNMKAGRRAPDVDRVVSFLRNHSDVPRLETDRGEGVHEALSELARREVSVLVVNGGDGTLQRALTEVLNAGAFEDPPMIAALRSGRTNMSALDIGSHADPVQAVAAVMEAARSGSMDYRVVRRPVLKVTMEPDGSTHYGMFFGAGVIQRAIDFTHHAFPEGRAQGVFGAGMVTGLLIARALVGSARDILTPDHVRVSLDGTEPTDGDYQLLIASTLDRLFLRLKPYWGTEDGAIRYTSIAAGSIGNPLAVLRILRGHRPRPDAEQTGLVSHNVERGEFQLDCGLTVDGELFGPRPGRTVRIAADRRIRFIRS